MLQAMAKVTKHFVEKYRCGLCGYRIEAKPPEALEGKKKVYTPELKTYLAMHKFFLAVPYHHMDSYQKMLNLPLPDSTQWNLIEALTSSCYPVFNHAKILAANSKIIWNDDTVNRILDVIAENKKNENNRTGMMTTCIMVETEDGHKIALYLNGTQHSGENVEDILRGRDDDKEPIIQMSDTLAANTPATYLTAVQKNEEAVTKNPEYWLPWNFEAQIKELTPHSPIHATALATGPPLVNPVVAQSAIRQRTG